MTDVDTPEATLEDGRMTIWEHLAELRTRIMKCIGAVLIGAMITTIFYDRVFDFLLKPYTDIRPDAKLYVTAPTDAFSLRIEVSIYGGIILAMGVILWQLWRFVTPGLYPHEKKYAVPFVLSSLVLFLLGAAIAYVSLTPALEFLESAGGKNFEEIYNPESFIKLIAFMMIAFGAGFEFPVLLVALQMTGVIEPKTLSGFRRNAMIIIVVAAAVITPSGDPISMLSLAVPMYFFYEVSILIGKVFVRRKARAEVDA